MKKKNQFTSDIFQSCVLLFLYFLNSAFTSSTLISLKHLVTLQLIRFMYIYGDKISPTG